MAAIILDGAMAYAAAGALVALAFAAIGIARVLPDAGPVTLGARLLILPGAALLWPYVVARWLAAGSAR